MSGEGLRLLGVLRRDHPSYPVLGLQLLQVLLEFLLLGAGGQPDLVTLLRERGDELLGAGEDVAAVLELGVELLVQLARLLGGLLTLDELRDKLVRALPDLFVDHGPRYWVFHLLQRVGPRLDVQVVGVHERPVYIQEHGLYQSILLICLGLLHQTPEAFSKTSAFYLGVLSSLYFREFQRPCIGWWLYGRGVPPVTPRVSPLTKLDSWEARKT